MKPPLAEENSWFWGGGVVVEESIEDVCVPLFILELLTRGPSQPLLDPENGFGYIGSANRCTNPRPEADSTLIPCPNQQFSLMNVPRLLDTTKGAIYKNVPYIFMFCIT